jgi:FdhD protein
MLILRWDGESEREQQDELAEEEPLEIRVRGRPISVTMRTPGHDAELAAGS